MLSMALDLLGCSPLCARMRGVGGALVRSGLSPAGSLLLDTAA
jgi:hypothetical protein